MLGDAGCILRLNSGEPQCFGHRSTRYSSYVCLGTRRLIRWVSDLQLVTVEYLPSIEGADRISWSAPFCGEFFGVCRHQMPSHMRGRWHGEAVTDEVEAAVSMRRCPPHQSPAATASPHRGSLWSAQSQSLPFQGRWLGEAETERSQQICDNLSVTFGDSIPTPFVPSGHFPLIGGIGPWKGSLGIAHPNAFPS